MRYLHWATPDSQGPARGSERGGWAVDARGTEVGSGGHQGAGGGVGAGGSQQADPAALPSAATAERKTAGASLARAQKEVDKAVGDEAQHLKQYHIKHGRTRVARAATASPR